MKLMYVNGRPVTRTNVAGVYYLYLDNEEKTVHCHRIKRSVLHGSCNPRTVFHAPSGDKTLQQVLMTISSLDDLVSMEVTITKPPVN